MYARRPERIPQDIVSRVNVIQGDVLNRQKVVEAMQGHDAVISCLGKGMNLCKLFLYTSLSLFIPNKDENRNILYLNIFNSSVL